MNSQIASAVLRIPLVNGKGSTIVDADYVPRGIRWHINQKPRTDYALRSDRTDGLRNISLHREVMEDMLGRALEPREQVDHINGFGLDNRRENLRLATAAENGRNRKKSKNNTSGYKGVHWDKHHRKWRAKIMINGRRLHLGHFADPADAARAYDNAAVLYYGDFALTNFPR